MESHYRLRGTIRGRKGSFQCVGGPSLFYGGTALRLRSTDFDSRTEIVGATGAAWPISYEDLEPYYRMASGSSELAGVRRATRPIPPRPPYTRTRLCHCKARRG